MRRATLPGWFSLLLPATVMAQWGPQAAAGEAPTALEASMVYDVFRAQTVLFGGNGGRETWSYTGGAWHQLHPTNAPNAQRRQAMTLDWSRTVTVLYGGSPSGNGMVANDETWEWDGANWARVATDTSPGGRSYHAMTFDLGRSRTVLYGGVRDTLVGAGVAETWEYDGANWTRVPTATNPGALRNMAMVYSINLGATVLFGGVDANGGSDATWLYDGSDWAPVDVPAPRPASRIGAQMVYDTARGVVVLFGGTDPVTGAILNDTWSFDGAHWVPVVGDTGGVYPARQGFSMVYDLARGRAVMVGGRIANNSLRTETWEYGAQFRTFGTGCAGSHGVPALASDQLPRLGRAFAAQLLQLDPQSPVALMVVGLDNRHSALGELPLNLTPWGLSGCRAYVRPDVVQVVGAAGGSATWNWVVPADANLVGRTLYLQGLSIEPGINPADLVVTNAGAAVAGH